jgi:hypothetical protein
MSVIINLSLIIDDKMFHFFLEFLDFVSFSERPPRILRDFKRSLQLVRSKIR